MDEKPAEPPKSDPPRVEPSAASTSQHSDKGHSPWRVFFIGVAIAIVLVWLSHKIERTTFGRWVGHNAFQLLHWQIEDDLVGSLPIVVINTSHLRSGVESNFDRGKLLSIIQAVADQKPAAIGVDFNYTLDEKEDLGTEDLNLLKECKRICLGPKPGGNQKAAIPVFLGLEEPLRSPLWINPDFREMATFIGVRRDDVRRLPRWIEFKDRSGKLQVLPSLSQAIADAYLAHHKLPVPAAGIPGKWFTLLEPKPFDPSKGAQVGAEPDGVRVSSLVNYQKAESIASETKKHLSGLNAEDLPSSDRHVHLAGKMVILGDMDVEDNFTIAGINPPVRGALLHACAAYTFSKSAVYELTPKSRIGLDFLVSLGLVIMVARCSRLDTHRRYRLKTGIYFGVISGVLVLSFLFIRVLSILWLDLIVISLALIIHPFAEEFIDSVLDRFTARK